MMDELSGGARKEGLMAFVPFLPQIHASFPTLCTLVSDTIRMAAGGGVEPSLVYPSFSSPHGLPSLQGLGIVAAVIGVVITMGNGVPSLLFFSPFFLFFLLSSLPFPPSDSALGSL